MSLDPSHVKRTLQDHLQEGLFLVVGTGPSIAEGIPGMGALATHLKTTIPPAIAHKPDPAWNSLVAALDSGDHLEAAMSKVTLCSTTVDTIIASTADLISREEKQVFAKVFAGKRSLPFTAFMTHLFKAGRRFHLITPNYDRLIELATEAAGIGVDCRFFGYLYADHNPKRAADAHRESFVSGRISSFRPTPSLCIHKPHGSLDWYEIAGKIVRSPVPFDSVPLIITPGTSKYRESFRWAFDDQRTSGNAAANSAKRLMFIGYGFNDDHLEQCLCPGLKLSKPTVIVTKDLSENAMKVVQNSTNTDVIALSAVSPTDLRTRVVTSQGNDTILDEQLWHLDGFNKGVL